MSDRNLNENQAIKELNNLLWGDKTNSYTVSDSRNIVSRVSTSVAGATSESIYLLYSGEINGQYSSQI